MRLKHVAWFVMLIAFVAGCVNYDERIELNADGSGVVRMHLAVNEQVLPQEFKAKSRNESDLFPMPRDELVRELEKDGSKVRSLRADSAQGMRHLYVVLEFKSVDALAKSEFFGARKVTFNRVGSTWRFRQVINVSEKTLADRSAPPKPVTPPERGAEKPPEKTESVLKQLEARFGKERVQQMLAGYRLTFSVQVGGAALIRSNGKSSRDTAAVWELPLNRLIDKKPTLRMEAEFASAEPSSSAGEARP